MNPFVRHLAVGMTAVAAFALAGCGDSDDGAGGTTTTDTTTTTEATTTLSAGGDTSTTEATGGTAAAAGPVAGCVNLPESADGWYDLGDAGRIRIESDGSTVKLIETQPASGWSDTGDTEDDDDEVDVDFASGDREVEFEAEIDDGRLDVEVCEDD